MVGYCFIREKNILLVFQDLQSGNREHWLMVSAHNQQHILDIRAHHRLVSLACRREFPCFFTIPWELAQYEFIVAVQSSNVKFNTDIHDSMIQKTWICLQKFIHTCQSQEKFRHEYPCHCLILKSGPARLSMKIYSPHGFHISMPSMDYQIFTSMDIHDQYPSQQEFYHGYLYF